jgi:hypothetical protein
MNQNTNQTIYVNRKSGREYHKIPSLVGGTTRIKRADDGKEFTVANLIFEKKYHLKGAGRPQVTTIKGKPLANGKIKSNGKSKPEEVTQVNIVKPDPERHNFSRMVLYPECISAIRVGVSRVLNRDKMEQIWQISKLDPNPRTILNFYGPSGTGKTKAAMCIASELNLPLFQVNYGEIVGSLHGESGKNIAMAFKAAKEAKGILFLDEADSLLSVRLDLHKDRQTCAHAVNSERNIFMQELDRFNGVVILTTNFFKNYDPAMIRRVAQHVEFKLPNPLMREQLLRLHIPSFDRVREINWAELGLRAEGLSGGDIYQVMVNAIHAASMAADTANWWLTEDHVKTEIQRVKAANEAHASQRRAPRQVIVPG